MHDLLGVVVLYHPDPVIADRIQTYMPELARLLVIDNTVPLSPIGSHLQQRWPAIELIVNRANLGIAGALNQAVDYGNKHGFKWLLTMDQDSSFEPNAAKQMNELLPSLPNDVAILAPNYRAPMEVIAPVAVEQTDLRFTMTSGNFLNLKSAAQCGPFLEKLFIDSVDHEYCLRLRRMHYRIVRINNAVLRHQPGEPTRHRFLYWQVTITHHSAERNYYMTRNRLFVISRYFTFDPSSCWYEFKQLIKSFVSIVVFQPNKREKLKAVSAGTWHFIIGHFGPYPAG